MVKELIELSATKQGVPESLICLCFLTVYVGFGRSTDQRIGSELVRTTLDECRKAGLVSIELAAFHTNSWAVQLYVKLGTKQVGIIPKKTQCAGCFSTIS